MSLNKIPEAKNHPLNTSMSLKKTISEIIKHDTIPEWL